MFPGDWYWTVADSATQVFASARGIYVPVTDAAYTAWRALGYVPSKLASEAELLDTLAGVLPGLVAQIPAGLIAYAEQKQAAIVAGGLTVNVGTQGAPINVKASTDTASLILLQGAKSKADANAGATFSWVQSGGAPVTLTAAQLIALYDAVQDFVQATFATLAAVVGGIIANPPTIATRALVDAPPAPISAWPINS